MKSIEIEVNKRKFTCSFGLGFLGECLENLDLSVSDIGERLDRNPFKWIPVLMYESIKYPNDKLDFSKEDLIEWLDDSEGNKTMNYFLMSFLTSLTKDVPKEEVVESDVKQPKKK